jgi:hypothetical protein
MSQQHVLQHEYVPFCSSIVVASVDITKMVMERTSFSNQISFEVDIFMDKQPNFAYHQEITDTIRNTPGSKYNQSFGWYYLPFRKEWMDDKENLLSAMYVELNGNAELDNKGKYMSFDHPKCSSSISASFSIESWNTHETPLASIFDSIATASKRHCHDAMMVPSKNHEDTPRILPDPML